MAAADLLLKVGRVLDPGRAVDALLDVAVTDGIVTRIGANIDLRGSKRVLDVSRKIVAPGLIDLHTHVAGGLRKIVDEETVVPPDQAGVHAGVTTIVDAGSTGAFNVGGLVNFVVPEALTRVYVFLNAGVMGASGSMGGGQKPEITGPADIDVSASIRAGESSPHIRGVKVRLVSPAVREMGAELPRLAKEIAETAGVPLLVHVGDIHEDHPAAVEVTRTLLSEILSKGDIVTHTSSHRVGALLTDGGLMDEALAARERGVWFDAGVGRSNFSFKSARQVIEAGFMPDSISSDATAAGRRGLVHSLTECMGKFMAIGLSVEDVIGLVTFGPARILGESGNIGGLREGAEADISVLEVIEGDWLFRDITGAIAESPTAIVPRHMIRAGALIPIDHGPRPWGWAPESR